MTSEIHYLDADIFSLVFFFLYFIVDTIRDVPISPYPPLPASTQPLPFGTFFQLILLNFDTMVGANFWLKIREVSFPVTLK